MNLEIDLTPEEIDSIHLLLSRLTFDDYLRQTDDGDDENQAYRFMNAAGKMRKQLEASPAVEPLAHIGDLMAVIRAKALENSDGETDLYSE